MAPPVVFDRYGAITASRMAFLRTLLGELMSGLRLGTAVDVGCGAGVRSDYLRTLGVAAVGVDARPGNVAKARARYPEIPFHVGDVQDPAMLAIGPRDLVPCFGLLYHLENPFRAVRNRAALAGAVFFVAFLNAEAVVHLIISSMVLSPEALIGGGAVQICKAGTKRAQAVFPLVDLLLVTVGLSWPARTALHKELGLFLRTPPKKRIAAHAVANTLASVVGIFQGDVKAAPGFFYTLKYIEYVVLYLMMVNNLREGRQARRFLGTGFATCAIASPIGIPRMERPKRPAALGAHPVPSPTP